MLKLCILLLFSVFACLAPASAAGLRTEDETAIRKQLAAYAEGRSQGSGERQASFYAVDGDEWELFADQKTVGRPAIAKLLDLPPDPNRRFRLEILDIIPLGSNAALVDAHWFRETSPKPRGRVQYLMVKEHRTWFIRSARINPYPPPRNP
jgi:hypothetical protein